MKGRGDREEGKVEEKVEEGGMKKQAASAILTPGAVRCDAMRCTQNGFVSISQPQLSPIPIPISISISIPSPTLCSIPNKFPSASPLPL